MTRNEIETNLLHCFAAVFPSLPVEAIPSASLHSTPEWDSLASVTLLAVLQQEFQIELPITELGQMMSFSKVLACIEKRMAAGNSSGG